MPERVVLSCPKGLGDELRIALAAVGLMPENPTQFRALPELTQFAVSLGSAGAFTALYQALSKWLERNRSHEITIRSSRGVVDLKGHNIAEEKDLIRLLAPGLLDPHDESRSGRERSKSTSKMAPSQE
jgi:hypothetical protein